MKLETFFEKFELIADAPNAVAKMRELVLELAVQGKLVEQKGDEGDGHALLRLIQKKNPVSDIETAAELVDAELASFPSSWAASKLGEVAEIIRGVSFPGSAKSETRSNGDVACLRTASVQAEIDWDDLIYISPSHVSRPDQWIAPNDIIISMANSYALVGKVAIVRHVPQKATFGAFLAAIRPILIEPYYLLYVLRSPRMQAAFRATSSQTTNIANISLGRMRPLPFPLPPLAEQKRIVAKVDELMALCDRLETQQKERETRHTALVRASLARFTEAPTAANLQFLFHPSYDVTPADLRKTILTLAVQGKLVPQDPNDEPAEELLEKIHKARRALAESGDVKTKVQLDPIGPGEEPYSIPDTWLWVPLNELAELVYGKLLPTTELLPEGFQVFGANGIIGRFSKYLYEDEMLLISCRGAYSGTPNISPPKCYVTNNSIVCEFFEPNACDIRFFHSAISISPREKIVTGSAQPQVTVANAIKLPVPLPPIAEQRRIVAKVEQLMALVDELEQQLAASRATAEKLLAALVAELTNGK